MVRDFARSEVDEPTVDGNGPATTRPRFVELLERASQRPNRQTDESEWRIQYGRCSTASPLRFSNPNKSLPCWPRRTQTGAPIIRRKSFPWAIENAPARRMHEEAARDALEK